MRIMKKKILIYLITGIVLVGCVFFLTQQTQALPEYSAQTGEPCASCHISPSGGGARAPRGQAWVGGGRPATVPGLLDSLELLGVHLTVDEATFKNLSNEVSPAQPLHLDASPGEEIRDWLEDYDGN